MAYNYNAKPSAKLSVMLSKIKNTMKIADRKILLIGGGGGFKKKLHA